MQTQTALSIDTLATRFGEVFYDETQIFNFPNGIIGMEEEKEFLIAPMPDSKMEKFQVLQSLGDNGVSFAIIPLAALGQLIDQDDLDEVREMLAIEAKNFDTMLVTSKQKTASGLKLSLNLRAPVLIDTHNNTGHQIILINSKYPVEHFLS